MYLQLASRFDFEVVTSSHFKVFICIVQYAFVQPYGLFLKSCPCGWVVGARNYYCRWVKSFLRLLGFATTTI